MQRIYLNLHFTLNKFEFHCKKKKILHRAANSNKLHKVNISCDEQIYSTKTLGTICLFI